MQDDALAGRPDDEPELVAAAEAVDPMAVRLRRLAQSRAAVARATPLARLVSVC